MTVKLTDLPVRIKLNNRLLAIAQRSNTAIEYDIELLDEVKKTCAIRWGKGGRAVLKLSEINRNLKSGDWILM